MISSRLLRAQTELGSHRLWLSTFISNTRPSSRTYSQVSPTASKRRGPSKTAQPRSKAPRNADRRIDIIRKFPANDGDVGLIPQLRAAVQEADIQKVIPVYAKLSAQDKKTLLSASDCRAIAQCLHYAGRTTEQRSSDAQTKRAAVDFLHSFSEALIHDIKAGLLAPHCQAHVHLLGFLKETGRRDTGVLFWEWIKQQDELFVNPDVYGAAIELLAVNGSPLADLEDLYQQALVRFPDPFLDYHLSPAAVVPDREVATTLKGIPMSLLQGILTARLLRGDARNAYLILDTALRLYPDQVPARFFQLFIQERPLLEAFTVFALACRAGTLVPVNVPKQMVAALRQSSDLSSARGHSFAIRSMLSTLHVYMLAGGSLAGNTVSELVIAMTQLLRLPKIAVLDVQHKQRLAEEVMDLIRMALPIFAQRGGQPGLSAFNSIIINIGGYGQSKQIIGTALTDALTLGLRPNVVTHRSIVSAAGMLRDDDFLRTAWSNLLELREESKQGPDATDFYIFSKSAAAAGMVDFAKQEFMRLRESLPERLGDEIIADPDNKREESSDSSTTSADLSAVLEEIQKIRSDLGVMEAVLGDGTQIPELNTAQFPVNLFPKQSTLPEAEMRRLYDEYTTDRNLTSAPVADADTNPATVATEGSCESIVPSSSVYIMGESRKAVSSTNIPFGVLRYENWKAINVLLAYAEASDQAYVNTVDEAIAAGIVPPQRPRGLEPAVHGKVSSFGLSDTVGSSRRNGDLVDATIDDAQIERGRAEIIRLRGPKLS